MSDYINLLKGAPANREYNFCERVLVCDVRWRGGTVQSKIIMQSSARGTQTYPLIKIMSHKLDHVTSFGLFLLVVRGTKV